MRRANVFRDAVPLAAARVSKRRLPAVRAYECDFVHSALSSKRLKNWQLSTRKHDVVRVHSIVIYQPSDYINSHLFDQTHALQCCFHRHLAPVVLLYPQMRTNPTIASTTFDCSIIADGHMISTAVPTFWWWRFGRSKTGAAHLSKRHHDRSLQGKRIHSISTSCGRHTKNTTSHTYLKGGTLHNESVQ